MTETPQKQRRGFACMTAERVAEIAAKGGGSVPHHKRSFSKNRELAREAGAAGGRASRGGRKAGVA